MKRNIRNIKWKIYWTKRSYKSWITCGLLDQYDRKTIESLKNQCFLEKLRPTYYKKLYKFHESLYGSKVC